MRLRRLLGVYLESGASQYASMLSFSLFVSIVPLCAGLLTVLGLVSRNPQRFSVAQQLLVDAFPPDAQAAVRRALLGAAQHAGVIGLLSVFGLVWFSTGLFSTAGFALNRIYRLPDRSFVSQRLRGLWLPLALSAVATIAIGVNVVIKTRSLPGWLGVGVTWLAITYLVLFAYRFAPSRMPKRSEVWPGAVFASFVIVGLSYALPLLGKVTSHLGTESRLFAVVAVLISWVYFMAQAILIGAVLNRTRLDGKSPPASSL